VITIDGYAWAIAGELSGNEKVGPAASAAMLKDLQGSEWSYVYYLTPVGFIVGMLMLAIEAARSGAIPTWAGVLLAVAVLMTGTETAIVSNEYFIAGAVVFLAAGIAVALPLLRMSDAEFAQGSS
jgi:energy-converting hydrogenase Eha subunit B